jgi:hypothetical protein
MWRKISINCDSTIKPTTEASTTYTKEAINLKAPDQPGRFEITYTPGIKMNGASNKTKAQGFPSGCSLAIKAIISGTHIGTRRDIRRKVRLLYVADENPQPESRGLKPSSGMRRHHKPRRRYCTPQNGQGHCEQRDISSAAVIASSHNLLT